MALLLPRDPRLPPPRGRGRLRRAPPRVGIRGRRRVGLGGGLPRLRRGLPRPPRPAPLRLLPLGPGRGADDRPLRRLLLPRGSRQAARPLLPRARGGLLPEV